MGKGVSEPCGPPYAVMQISSLFIIEEVKMTNKSDVNSKKKDTKWELILYYSL